MLPPLDCLAGEAKLTCMHVPHSHHFVIAKAGKGAKSPPVKNSGRDVCYNEGEHSVWRNSYLVQFIAQDLNIQFI